MGLLDSYKKILSDYKTKVIDEVKERVLGVKSDENEGNEKIITKEKSIIHLLPLQSVIPNLSLVVAFANMYFDILTVPLYVKLFDNNLLNSFNYDMVKNNEGICIIGNRENLRNFVLKKIYVKYNISNIGNLPVDGTWENTMNNMSEASRQNPKSNFLFNISDNLFDDNPQNPETSTNGILDVGNKKINIVAINHNSCNLFLNIQKIKNRLEELIGYFIVHGVGHNASFSYGGTHSNKGIMMSGDDLAGKNLKDLYDIDIEQNQVYKEHVEQRFK